MAFAAPALAVASTVVSGIGAIRSANYKAAVARNNYNTALRNEVAASDAAQEKQKRSDFEYAALAGEQEAAQGASGLDMLGRSQVLTRALTARTRTTAATDIRRAGEAEVAGFNAEAQNALIQKGAAKSEAKLALLQMGLGLAKVATGGSPSGQSLSGGASSLRSKLFG